MTIFVDSYASTMITGSVMRPITDKFDISREKLATSLTQPLLRPHRYQLSRVARIRGRPHRRQLTTLVWQMRFLCLLDSFPSAFTAYCGHPRVHPHRDGLGLRTDERG